MKIIIKGLKGDGLESKVSQAIKENGEPAGFKVGWDYQDLPKTKAERLITMIDGYEIPIVVKLTY